MFKTMVKFMSDEKGLETVEYALMAGLVVAAIATAVALLATNVAARLNTAAGNV